MHVPKIFEMIDQDIIRKFIHDNSFATLISVNKNFPVATHIPLDLVSDEQGKYFLWGHVSKANPHWKLFESHPQVLAIFISPVHHYISSSWYEQPNAPTWNYESVHVYGTIQQIEGEKLWKSLRRLTETYEGKFAENPISLENPHEDITQQINGIVGFEIDIEKIEAVSKLSQNRHSRDYDNIIEQLRKLKNLPATLMAERMEEVKESQR